MAQITAALVKELREATNAGMMECKHALQEADGDLQKAVRVLRERGVAVAARKASRTAGEGRVASATVDDGRIVTLVEVNCETDFVARNATFAAFCQRLAERAARVADGSLADTVKDEVTAKIAEMGENLVVARHVRFERSGPGLIVPYIHLGAKVGVLVEVGCGKEDTVTQPAFQELAKDLAMHVAASSPRYLSSRDIPPDVLAGEREIYAKQVTGKPAPIVEKIVDGRMRKFFAEVCLLDQGFVKEPKLPVSKHLQAVGKPLGETPVVRRFVRFQVGLP